jgi:hypothetical protein
MPEHPYRLISSLVVTRQSHAVFLSLPLAHCDRQRLQRPAANDIDAHRLADTVACKQSEQAVAVGDDLAVEPHDEIAQQQPRLFRGTPFLYENDQESGLLVAPGAL